MKPANRILLLFLAPALLTCGGCAKRLIFATKTNLGLDVSGTAQMPDKVSFTYGRYEGAIVPRSQSGDPYSVYGGLDADVSFWNGVLTVSQEFATGTAAQIAAGEMGKTEAERFLTNISRGTNSDTKSLYFVTDSSLGIKISAGKQDISPTLTVGYKRVEGAVIPVEKTEKEVRSVYANIKINSAKTAATGSEDETHAKTVTTAFPYSGGIRLVQGFATGRAADLRAMRPDVQKSLKVAAEAGAVVAANISDLDKVAIWIAGASTEDGKKTRFRDALAGIYPTQADIDAQFAGIAPKDEEEFKKWFRLNVASKDRATAKVKENTRDNVSF